MICVTSLLLSCINCTTQHPASGTTMSSISSSPYFNLLDSKYEIAVSGLNGARSTEYYFTISVLTEQSLKFDSAWIEGKRLEIYISRKSTGISSSAQQIKRGDQLILRVSDLHTETAKRVPAPIQFDGKALLRYHVSSTQHYLAIKDINLQKSPNRQ
jgi:hypothetical protein